MPIPVLYVDDEPDLRELAEIALELDPELALTTCASGQEALDLLETWTPKLILLDMMMPGMDGAQTIAKIHERDGDAIPVVFISAMASEADQKQLLALGAAGFIAKPFDLMKLSGTIRGFIDDE